MPAAFLLALLGACSPEEPPAPPAEAPPAAEVSIPPAEPRPKGMRPSALWLPELKRYQYARRKAFEQKGSLRTDLDLSTARESRERKYRVEILERPEPVALNEFQSWRLRVAGADGKPVPGAVVNVGGGMPEHGHPLPSRPQVSPGAAAGEYRVEGLQFSMPGWWEIHVYVSKDRSEDTATFNLLLE